MNSENLVAMFAFSRIDLWYINHKSSGARLFRPTFQRSNPLLFHVLSSG